MDFLEKYAVRFTGGRSQLLLGVARNALSAGANSLGWRPQAAFVGGPHVKR